MLVVMLTCMDFITLTLLYIGFDGMGFLFYISTLNIKTIFMKRNLTKHLFYYTRYNGYKIDQSLRSRE